jgi:transcriptional regulator of acetoin/glycerol metabolism
MHLAIVKKGQFSTFELLARAFQDDPTVRVIWDRRTRDRRQAPQVALTDRRRSDRRHVAATSWSHHHYVFVSVTGGDHAPPLVQTSIGTSHVRSSGRGLAALDRDIECAIRFDHPVLISGGDGLGRTCLASAIHSRSARSRGPFVVFDPARGRTVFDAALFTSGHGGTVFITEVGALDEADQQVLWQFFDSRVIARPGSPDTRIITATGGRLFERVRSHAFRHDLLYYLNLMHLEVADEEHDDRTPEGPAAAAPC